MNSCFECGESEGLHNHHIVPRSLGGKKTVALCESCHGKVHGVDFTDHGVLIKIGLSKTTKELGRPNYGKFEGEQEVLDFIGRLRENEGQKKQLSFFDIAQKLNEQGIPSRSGKKWHGEVVRRLLGAKRKREESEIKKLSDYPDIIECLNNGISIRKTAKLTGHGPSTVQRVKIWMAKHN